MASAPRPVVRMIGRFGVRPLLRLPPRGMRRALELLSHASVVPRGAGVSRAERGGVGGELLVPEGVGGPERVLYLHGGGYVVGSPRTHRNVTAALALESGFPTFAPDYRLAPEHPAPAALDDALASYAALAEEAAPAVAGDSAGGGLALALAVAARDRGLPAPRCLALISPWVGALAGQSITTNDGRDALLTRRALAGFANAYMSSLGPDDPRCAPLHAELAGLPPILIHAGGDDVLRSDSEALATRARAAGVDVELHVFEGLWHGFHVHAGMLRDADEAVAAIGAWIAERLGE